MLEEPRRLKAVLETLPWSPRNMQICKNNNFHLQTCSLNLKTFMSDTRPDFKTAVVIHLVASAGRNKLFSPIISFVLFKR